MLYGQNFNCQLRYSNKRSKNILINTHTWTERERTDTLHGKIRIVIEMSKYEIKQILYQGMPINITYILPMVNISTTTILLNSNTYSIKAILVPQIL